MSKICPKCKKVYSDDVGFCKACGEELTVINPAELPKEPVKSNPKVSPATESDGSAIKEKFVAILGFVSSILGVYCFSIVLLPLSFALCGFNITNRKHLKGIAIAGLVISIVAIFLKIALELYNLDLIPEWLYQGVF